MLSAVFARLVSYDTLAKLVFHQVVLDLKDQPIPHPNFTRFVEVNEDQTYDKDVASMIENPNTSDSDSPTEPDEEDGKRITRSGMDPSFSTLVIGIQKIIPFGQLEREGSHGFLFRRIFRNFPLPNLKVSASWAQFYAQQKRLPGIVNVRGGVGAGAGTGSFYHKSASHDERSTSPIKRRYSPRKEKRRITYGSGGGDR
ncbi:hypothetical protein GQ44DRAFT_773958 [Phaeosphaeriaceae sp. PMI808]|nr:hypothetical protein GQ44DRAFT_773958 [Phaeosphaeriaceae sp. PMI808]